MAVTVPQVFKSLGLEYDKHVNWGVGREIERKFRKAFGRPPTKDNGPKSNRRSGSHCFAHYPDDWRPKIEAAIRRRQVQEAKQKDMFA